MGTPRFFIIFILNYVGIYYILSVKIIWLSLQFNYFYYLPEISVPSVQQKSVIADPVHIFPNTGIRHPIRVPTYL